MQKAKCSPRQVPTEYREILQQGMGLTYGINALAAVYARGIAERKQEPVNFWSVRRDRERMARVLPAVLVLSGVLSGV